MRVQEADGTRARRAAAALLALALAGALGACGSAGDGDSAAPAAKRASEATGAGGGWIGEEGDLEWSSAAAAGRGPAAGDAAPPHGSGEALAAPVATVEPAGPAGPREPVEPSDEATAVDARLNAGSVDDNERWEDYLLYREDALASGLAVHDVDIGGRRILRVVDGGGAPVLGATVEIVAGDGPTVTRRSTQADGRMMFFAPGAASGSQDPAPALVARVSKGEAATEAELSREHLVYEVVLDGAPAAPDPVPLDLLFLIDATGSMGDEIEQLKANMVSVAEQIDALSPRPDVRFAMSVYRDHGDLFLTRTFDFTTDVAQFTDALRAVVAEGGGDYAEALDQGLHDALHQPAWRDGEAVRLIFLVADAPPHIGDGLDSTTVDYAVDAIRAAERGVKIHPIAASETDRQAEFVMRQLAQLTFGRFNFLTYGADGASPGDSTPHHVDDYAVLSLDELVVQLVADELAALRG